MTAALLRYRIAAYVVGILLLLLVVAMYMKYAQDDDRFMWVAMIHGWFYLIYLGLGFDLYRRALWPGKVMAAMIAGGLVPGLVFFVERRIAGRALPPARPAKAAPVRSAPAQAAPAKAAQADAAGPPAPSKAEARSESGES